jgi:hypothetical protein
MARGKYVWLISADDRLRVETALERYVDVMEEHPNVGYICCPGIGLLSGKETAMIKCGYFGPHDKIFNGRAFIAASLEKGYGLLAPSVMVRKECYDNIACFPLDMPHQGDWYLWLRWALDYDVAYVSEPLVNYRDHDLNIMKDLMTHAPATLFSDEVSVLSRTRKHCYEKGFPELATKCEDALASVYARAAASALYDEPYYPDLGYRWAMTVQQCEQGLRDGVCSESAYRSLRAKFFASLGGQHWRHSAFGQARQSYRIALRTDWKLLAVWLKLAFLSAGLGRAAVLARGVMRPSILASSKHQATSQSEPNTAFTAEQVGK